MGTYQIARTRGRVTSTCTWCKARSGPQPSDVAAEAWQRRHVCCPEKTRPDRDRRSSDAR